MFDPTNITIAVGILLAIFSITGTVLRMVVPRIEKMQKSIEDFRNSIENFRKEIKPDTDRLDDRVFALSAEVNAIKGYALGTREDSHAFR